MSVKEKLVELLKKTEINKINGHTVLAETCFTPNVFENMATNLIAHGVTVQEWISVNDRLPKPTYCVLVVGAYGEMEIDALGTDGEWMEMVEDVTHWMPLPQPPKGE